MTDTAFTPNEEDEALACEYVLGVLDLASLRAVEARMKREAGFAELVANWEIRLAGMNEDFDEVAAPDLLPRIEARLFPVQVKPRRSLVGWLSGAAVAGALAAAAVVVLTPSAPDVVAVLASTDSSLSYSLTNLGDRLTVTRTSGTAAPAGQVHQLWIIAPESSPVSLGLLANEVLVIDYPIPPPGWTFAVSLEPEGGSPSGLPTGPVILSAQMAGNT